VQNEKAHEQVTTGPPEAIRLSLRDGFTAYSALSPAIGLVVTVPGAKRQLRHRVRASVEALRPRGFAVRFGALRPCAPKASIASRAQRP
jgi:hypothetical protein